jgi:vacuolar iron transporter family protein
MDIGTSLQRLRSSFSQSAGTIVFGMEDGTVSIFGLIFGVAATTTDPKTVLIAGASGAVSAAVSMMAGAYLDVETTRDAVNAARSSFHAAATSVASLSKQLAKAGLTSAQSEALAVAVQSDPDATSGLLRALHGAPETASGPLEQALWMLFADFLAAAVPILPFVFVPVLQARIVSGTVTLALLIALGIGRAQIAKRDMVRTVVETVSIGVAAALAGIAIGVLVDRLFSHWALQRCICIICCCISPAGITRSLRLAMIHSEPPITRMTISTPKASASALLVLSGSLVMWRKKTRCTPIWATASIASMIGMPGPQISDVRTV